MVVLRCTRKLLVRLPTSIEPAVRRSTTALGDWYATLLVVRPQQLLVFVSERSRLPVVVPAKDVGRMTIRFRAALEQLLRDLAVPEPAIAAELSAMREVDFARTIDRHVLGSLNEFVHQVRWILHDEPGLPLSRLSLSLARTPILPMHDFPDRMTRRLLEQRLVHRGTWLAASSLTRRAPRCVGPRFTNPLEWHTNSIEL